MAESLNKVFISYASQDRREADTLCAALEAAGLPCWIAPRDVRAGESYAAAIVQAINSCRMLLLVLSRSAIESPHVLREIERASSKNRPVLSIRLDTTALPPEMEYFLSANQWLEVADGRIEAILPALIDSVRRNAAPSDTRPIAHPSSGAAPSPPPRSRALIALGAVILAVLAFLLLDRFWLSRRVTTQASEPAAPSTPTPAAANPGGAAAFAPPPHSIAVLPFVNMSGDAKQDYFSDGLSEELINSLTSIRDLQVAAQTSSFYFKGKEVDLPDIAHKLNVGAILEGSVRKDGAHVRITAQLINTVTGFHLWSQSYDRELKDILKLQTEIATAVTQALKATLLADTAASIELGGTQNPQAYDAYLRGENASRDVVHQDTVLAGIAALDEAIRLDPAFARAYVRISVEESLFAAYFAMGSQTREYFGRAREAAEKAVALAPNLGRAHAALGAALLLGYFDFRAALAEQERALSLSPNDSLVLLWGARLYAMMGRADEAVALGRRGVALDQLNPRAHRYLIVALEEAHRYREALEATDRGLSLGPDLALKAFRGRLLLHLGDPESARQSCETPPLDWLGHLCLAIAYDKLQRRSDAEAQLAAMKADTGDSTAYQYAEIYAQWGDTPQALNWLETAYRLGDPGITGVKVDDFLIPLRNEPRFREVERKLNAPD